MSQSRASSIYDEMSGVSLYERMNHRYTEMEIKTFNYTERANQEAVAFMMKCREYR